MNLVVDKSIESVKISLTIREPLTADGAWNVFLTVLEMSGFSIIKIPGDVDTEGLETMCVGVSIGQREQLLVGLAGCGTGVGRERTFKFNGAVPIGTELGFRFLEGILCGQSGIELHR